MRKEFRANVQVGGCVVAHIRVKAVEVTGAVLFEMFRADVLGVIRFLQGAETPPYVAGGIPAFTAKGILGSVGVVWGYVAKLIGSVCQGMYFEAFVEAWFTAEAQPTEFLGPEGLFVFCQAMERRGVGDGHVVGCVGKGDHVQREDQEAGQLMGLGSGVQDMLLEWDESMTMDMIMAGIVHMFAESVGR